MIRTERKLFLGLLLACVFSSSVTADCTAIKKECCQDKLNSTECDRDFKLWVNSSLTSIKEGDDVTLECSHTIPALNLSYSWFKNGEKTEDHNKTFSMKKVLTRRNGKYKCSVDTTCGNCESQPFDLKVENNSIVIFVVCGVSALGLIIIMGVAMKIKLMKDKREHKERMKQRAEQRAQDAQNSGPIPFPRGY